MVAASRRLSNQKSVAERRRSGAARNSIGLVLVGGMTIGTIFTLFIVPSLYMLIAKEHHEKSLAEPETELAEEDELVPEYAPALRDGNGWKQS